MKNDISLACKTVTIGTKERTTLFKGQGSENPLQVRVIKNHENEFLNLVVNLALASFRITRWNLLLRKVLCHVGLGSRNPQQVHGNKIMKMNFCLTWWNLL